MIVHVNFESKSQTEAWRNSHCADGYIDTYKELYYDFNSGDILAGVMRDGDDFVHVSEIEGKPVKNVKQARKFLKEAFAFDDKNIRGLLLARKLNIV